MPLRFGATGKLARGEHPATWQEVELRLGFTATRRRLLKGLLEACRELKSVGVKRLYLDGSFATQKPIPGDFDCCYDLDSLEFEALPAVFKDFSNKRAAQKERFGGEFFPAEFQTGNPPEPYRTFFQHDKLGKAKGIIVLDLETIP